MVIFRGGAVCVDLLFLGLLLRIISLFSVKLHLSGTHNPLTLDCATPFPFLMMPLHISYPTLMPPLSAPLCRLIV